MATSARKLKAVTKSRTNGNGRDFDVHDLGLAEAGRKRIEWADKQMPVLRRLRERFTKEQPLKGQRMGACLHITCETANLLRTLKAGGAEVIACASNPLSTQDDVAAALVDQYGIPTFAIHGEDRDTYYSSSARRARTPSDDHDGRRRRPRQRSCTPSSPTRPTT